MRRPRCIRPKCALAKKGKLNAMQFDLLPKKRDVDCDPEIVAQMFCDDRGRLEEEDLFCEGMEDPSPGAKDKGATI